MAAVSASINSAVAMRPSLQIEGAERLPAR